MGTFEYLRMPFGLMNVGATFQRAMNYAFKELIGKIIEIYQDDLTVFSKERPSHIGHLKQVFERCRKYGISLNPAKSVFGIDQGKLLGHIISKDGVKIDPERIEAIKKIPLSKNVKALQSFNEIDVPIERLKSFDIFRKGDLFNGFDSFRVNLDPIFRDDVT